MTKEELEKEAEGYADTKYIQGTTEWKKVMQTYIDCAEPREKRIEELEARCNELFLQTCEQAEEIKELEKENADLHKSYDDLYFSMRTLKEENAELKSEKGCETCTKFDEVQLTKAKEIIKNLVEFDSSYKDDEEYQRKSELYDKIWEEAEQFIIEVEK